MKRTIASLLLLFIPLAACMATEGSEVLEAGEIGEVNAPLLTETYPPPPCIPTEEVCDEADNDCDGDIDECGCPPPPPCSDNDEDGVCAEDDLCPGTEVGETKVPSIALGVNRFALVDEDFQFDTMLPYGQGPQKIYTTTDTGGCSCEQIIKKQSLGQGHTKFGCSISAMDDWVAIVNAN